MRKRVLPLVVLIVLGFSACSDDSQTKQQTASKQRPALPVKVFEVKNETPTISKEYPAVITPFEEVKVIARVSGTLEEKFFKEGQYVKKGQLLYKIEEDVYKTNLNMASANVKKAQANYNKSLKDYKRANALLKSKSISVQKYDEYVYIYQDAKAQLESSKASLQKAKIEYDYATVEAPISGVVGIKQSDIGDYVGTNASNSLLVTITSINPVHVEFSLTKNDVVSFIEQVRSKKVYVTLDVHGKSYKGEIDYISPRLDLDTDTLLLRAKFNNDDNNLIVGEFTKISLNNITVKNVHIIPEEAILKTANGDFVYVVKDDIAKLRPVKLGTLLESGVVVKTGLNVNDKVVISNIAKVRPDTKVQVLGK
ncbi:efflux transporter periplasmic adaptor subunit [Malaciobacter halophilus]|uniref:Efflux transporter periplasmic adaptor subunit n=1 Tax=Malaciobacter halophilus TaxID=197482 RepID=A0A2N1J5Y8_9BACT|nr:efflux RND transporter periplasmic adaptor subunit [Malaciobacter halophilus]AXH09570.1 RND family efflux system, membrane fusion protein [Malaciobacter halophilus]PKI81970.1 efflux transporter periplasmic adaptor subunit [Malaciobacter halophilus]